MKKQAVKNNTVVKIPIEDMPNINQPFFNLRQAWIIKGMCCAWGNFSRYRYIQPLGGLYEGRMGGKGVFTNATIKEWLTLTDEDMAEYHRKHKTGAKPRGIKLKISSKRKATA